MITKDEYQGDILDLQRKILKGVQLKNVDFAEKLNGQDKINFLKYCSEITNNGWFEQIFPALFFEQLLASANAENYDEVSFHRATINGINLVKEYFKKQARQFDIETGPREKPEDPHASFETVDKIYKV